MRMCVQRSRLTTKLAMYRCAQRLPAQKRWSAALLEGNFLGQCHQTVLERHDVCAQRSCSEACPAPAK